MKKLFATILVSMAFTATAQASSFDHQEHCGEPVSAFNTQIQVKPISAKEMQAAADAFYLQEHCGTEPDFSAGQQAGMLNEQDREVAKIQGWSFDGDSVVASK